MALKLVEEMSEKWKPEAFTDTYRDDLMKRIEQKVKAGQTHTLTEPEDEADRASPRAAARSWTSCRCWRRASRRKAAAQRTRAARATKRKHSAARRRTTNPRAARRA